MARSFRKGKSPQRTEESYEVSVDDGIIAVMSLGVKCGQTVEVEVTGTDEENACASMQKFFEDNL